MPKQFPEYKKLSFNELKKLEYSLKSIEKAAQFFYAHFLNKEMIYTTSNRSISVVFKRSNFMHLCGLKYEDGAAEFFNLALIKQIDFNKIFIKKDGTTFQKLSVLNTIDFLISDNLTLSEGAHYLNLSFDNALRTKKKIFALTLINDTDMFIPQSLLNLKFINNFPTGEKIISIKSVHLQNSSQTVYL